MDDSIFCIYATVAHKVRITFHFELLRSAVRSTAHFLIMSVCNNVDVQTVVQHVRFFTFSERMSSSSGIYQH